MREARTGCQDHSHAHRRLVWQRPVSRDDTPGADFLVSIWLCPVFHSVGIWAGFPVAGDAVPAVETADEPGRRRLFHRD